MGTRPLDQSDWLRWLVPPVRDLIFVVLLLSLTCGSLAERLLRDGGTGWHIRTGQRILATHAVPQTDPFSLSTAGKPWYAWEWLYDAGLGAVYNFAGLNGAVVVTGLLIAGTFAWLFCILRRRGTDLATALLLLMLALGAAAIHLYVRPHVFGWLFTLAWWFLLERAREKDDTTRLMWLPLLMLLWVNMHGGFLFGLALLAIYYVEAIWRWWRERAEPGVFRWLRGLMFASVASVLATFMNPYGYHLHIHIYQYLADPFLMKHIEEFQSPNLHTFSPVCFAVLLALGFAGALLAPKTSALREWLVLLLAAFAGLYAARDLPVSSLLVAAIAGPYISEAVRERLNSRGKTALSNLLTRLGERDATLPGGPWIVAAVVPLLWIAAHGGKLGSVQVMSAQFGAERFPVAAVNYLDSEAIRKPLFSVDQWGGYLIYREYQAVLVDDRHDLYGAEFFKRYLKIIHAEPGWPQALDHTTAELVLLPTNSPLAGALRTTSGWKEEYRDRTAVLFERTH